MANWSPETNRKRSIALKGRKQTAEHIANRVAARRAKKPREIYARGFYRGHPTICFTDEQTDPECFDAWRYADDLTETPENDTDQGIERPCIACHQLAEPHGPDPCLGWLPGVKAACCGHGVEEPYVLLDDGSVYRERMAMTWFLNHGRSTPMLLTQKPATSKPRLPPDA
jgi:hypothetical protein